MQNLQPAGTTEALERLCASLHSNRIVRDIADHLVHPGELLGSSPGDDRRRHRRRNGRGRSAAGKPPLS